MAGLFFKVAALGSQPAGSMFGGTPRDAGVIKAASRELLKLIWEESTGPFVEAIAREMIRESGESGASLQPLARLTNTMLNFTRPLKLGRKRPQLNPVTGAPKKGTVRSQDSGERAGASAFKFEFTATKASFEFKIPIFQFALHETGLNKGSNTKLFGALDKAQAAQREFVLRQYRVFMPEMIREWILTGKVSKVSLGSI